MMQNMIVSVDKTTIETGKTGPLLVTGPWNNNVGETIILTIKYFSTLSHKIRILVD